jgi:ADP-ribose pyrophosphatase
LHEGRFLAVKSRNGWEYVTRVNASGVVAVIATTVDEELILVEQYRPPIRGRVLELPAGLAGDLEDARDEPLIEAAKRELLEETGFVAETMESIGSVTSSAGLTDEQTELFLARRATRVGVGGGDESEEITTHLVPVAQLEAWLGDRRRAGLHIDSRVYSALYFAARAE